jgi:protoporphyrinogen oxidase
MAEASGHHCRIERLPTAIQTPAVVIGAGPAGLTAAWELQRLGVSSHTLEASAAIGGLSRTESYKGYLYDIGGHRFYTKISLIEDLWREMLGDDLLTRSRLSRIYYRGKFFRYPLEPLDALARLGVLESSRCVFSYLWANLVPIEPETNFSAWVSNRFGRRLFEIFFEAYTEKVWGIPCNQISADWAAQRIKDLSLHSLVAEALLPRRNGHPKQIKTLIHQFLYPRRGPGMLWERMAERLECGGARVLLESPVERISWRNGEVTSVECAGGHRFHARNYISSMALGDLLRVLDPAPPAEVSRALAQLRYRDFITVLLIVKQRELFPDNWIYVHEPRVKAGRIQNYKNWSPDMVPDPETTSLGIEYFATEGDALWTMSDAELLDTARREMAELRLVDPELVSDGTVLRVRKAYPVYDGEYQRELRVIRDFLATFGNLQQVGRNGMHHYNNQDHSMLTGIMAARNAVGERHDLWNLLADSEYLEQGLLREEDIDELEKTQPAVPVRVAR